ncbi:outer membrane receptor protein involved in Fe transport [Lutibacter sp. Hel_I_33_5]|uniref:TonB-dependent receptor domain-containing protein n=1 Tax=Lutibacter sp. Hel_I_33_5 TaxID=1566289 RepID=UPI0011ABB548|nr:TonB-dependent receptor [Lutibacter sp. Hel_I_33_5]TVZ55992.1 outer membrane receptor protein involved in Fe transport [Lutibacter sp. Hel_I_33_5]
MMSQKKTSLSFNKVPLQEVLVTLENKFEIKFSYNSELIKNQLITFDLQKVTLETIFESIEYQSEVEFEKVTNRYYILKRRTTIDLSKIQNLDEIVVKEYLTSGIHKKNDGSIVFSPSKLGILPGLTEPDVLQSLQLLPGIQSPTETASGLYVRGGTPDQNLILWDGIKMYHSGHFFGMISAFNPYITKDVKLYVNETKAKYGGRISSVIDITSSDKIPDTIEGGVGFNLTHADAYLKIPVTKKVALIASARRSFNDVFESVTFTNISKKVFQNTKISDEQKILEGEDITQNSELFKFSDITLKAIFKPSEKDKITVSNLFAKNVLDFGFTIDEFNETIRDQLNIKNHGSSILWNHDSSTKLSYSLQAYISNLDLDYNGLSTFETTSISEIIRQNNVEDFGVLANADWILNKANSVAFGYQLSQQKIRYQLNFKNKEENLPEEVNNYEDIQKNKVHSLFGEYQYKKEDDFILNGGLRVNYISTLEKLFVEPRIRAQVRLSSELKYKISVEQLYQSVSQIVEFQDEGLGLENQTWILADGEEIPVLKSNQVSTGFAFNKNGTKIDIDGYYKKIDGLTSLTKGFDNPTDVSFFKGKSTVFGIDVLIKKKIDNYRSWISYSFINNQFKFEDVNNGEFFPGNFDVKHHLTWAHSYAYNNFNFSLGFNMRTGTPYTNALGISLIDDTPEINYNKTNGARLPNYSRLDFSATYKFNLSTTKKWVGKIGFSVLNIANRKNILGRSYKISSNFDSAIENFLLQEINRYSLGFTPNLVFRVAF